MRLARRNFASAADQATGARQEAALGLGGAAGGEEGDWVLVIPDTTEPVTHLWAEAGDEPAAVALAEEYEALIRRAAELE